MVSIIVTLWHRFTALWRHSSTVVQEHVAHAVASLRMRTPQQQRECARRRRQIERGILRPELWYWRERKN